MIRVRVQITEEYDGDYGGVVTLEARGDGATGLGMASESGSCYLMATKAELRTIVFAITSFLKEHEEALR